MYTSDKLCHTDSKIFPSTRSAFKIDFACPRASDGIQIHCSTQGFSAIKCVQSMRHKARDSRDKFALLLLLCRQIGCSVRGQTRICYIIGFEIIRIHPSTRYRIRCGLIFFYSGELIQKYPDSLSNSPDTCKRYPNPERIRCGFKCGLGLKLPYVICDRRASCRM